MFLLNCVAPYAKCNRTAIATELSVQNVIPLDFQLMSEWTMNIIWKCSFVYACIGMCVSEYGGLYVCDINVHAHTFAHTCCCCCSANVFVIWILYCYNREHSIVRFLQSVPLQNGCDFKIKLFIHVRITDCVCVYKCVC